MPGLFASSTTLMPIPVFHYTTGDRFLQIIASRAILPATAHVTPPEIPAVWLSSAAVWEPSATKGVIENGIRRQASLSELISICGCLVRIEIDPSVVPWLGSSEFREALRIRPSVYDRLIAAGLEMGADPANWSAVAGPVALTAFRRIEFTIEADPPQWIPWPGFRSRAH
ncbi:MAG: hypothetical protein RLZZ214_3959 [Verrucomicrobiota bacterium]|jgi:hypothetical protein